MNLCSTKQVRLRPEALVTVLFGCLAALTLGCDPGSGGGGLDLGVGDSPNGAPCRAHSECASGFCPPQDDVCCEVACDGECVSCEAGRTGGADGVCLPVIEDRDPDGECTDQGEAACGSNGSGCNGDASAPGCNLYPADTLCAVAGCSGDELRDDGRCDGSGTCVTSPGVPCAPYACATGGCLTSCAAGGDDDCAAGFHCGPSDTCVADRADGEPCDAANECASGSCVDDTCCASESCGVCEACDVDGSGACAPVVSADDDTCNGVSTCDADGACKLALAETCGTGSECASGSCVDDTCCAESSCGACRACDISGDGTCAVVDDETPCDADGGDRCVAGNCVPCPARFFGLVTNTANPTTSGAGVASVWAFQGQLGIAAGHLLCEAIGADRVCDYRDLLLAEERGELQGVPDTTTLWLHRVTEAVTPTTTYAPGAGGRCNDWTYPLNEIADGEYAVMGEVTSGELSFHFDSDTLYTGTADHAEAGLDCGGATRAIPCCTDPVPPVCL